MTMSNSFADFSCQPKLRQSPDHARSQVPSRQSATTAIHQSERPNGAEVTDIASQFIRRRTFLAGAGLLALAGCSSAGKTGSGSSAVGSHKLAQEDGLYVLRAFTTTGFQEFQLADELGFFKDAGIKIKYVGALPSGTTDLQLIQQGQADVSYSGHPATVAQARLSGVQVTMVAPGMVDDPKHPHVTYLVKKGNSKINSLKDIGGAKIGISASGVCTDGYLKYYAQKNSINPKSLSFITMPTGGQPEQAVLQGLIDVTDSHTPYAGIAEDTGKYSIIGTTWDIFQTPAAGLGARTLPDWIIRNYPQVAQGFSDAMYRARLWSNANLTEAGNLVAAVLKLKPGDVRPTVQDSQKNITPSYIELWFNIAEEISLWKHGDIKETDIYTNAFVPKDAPVSDKTLSWSGKVQNNFKA